MAEEIIDKGVEEEALIEENLEALDESTDWKAKAEELERKRREDGIKQRERSKALKQQLAEAKRLADEAKKPQETPSQPKTGELDETQLDYLDLKGITEDEDISIIKKAMKTGELTLRQALKDEYVVEKLKANKDNRDNKAATPTSTKRGAAQESSLDGAVAKYERTGELPSDFDLRKKVVNAMYQKNNRNKPAWHQ